MNLSSIEPLILNLLVFSINNPESSSKINTEVPDIFDAFCFSIKPIPCENLLSVFFPFCNTQSPLTSIPL